MDYQLKLPNEQNDFNRYIAHAQAYAAEDLDLAVRGAKNMLIDQLKFLPMQPCVYLNILSSEETEAYVIFDALNNDVSLKVVSSGFNGYTAYIMEGKENRARISVGSVNPEVFANYISKPLKLLLLFLINDVIIFIQEQQRKWIEVPKLIQSVKAKAEEIKKAMEKGNDNDGNGTAERNADEADGSEGNHETSGIDQ